MCNIVNLCVYLCKIDFYLVCFYEKDINLLFLVWLVCFVLGGLVREVILGY